MFPFFDEVGLGTQMKTGAARFHIAPVKGMELGVSGIVRSPGPAGVDDDTTQWMYGVDFHYHRQNLVLRGEFVQGLAKGKTEVNQPHGDGVQPGPVPRLQGCLRALIAYRRHEHRSCRTSSVDWRDALHQSGASFVYISEARPAGPPASGSP